jgi:hypothetical protein
MVNLLERDGNTNIINKHQWHPIKNVASENAHLNSSLRTQLWDIIESDDNYTPVSMSTWNVINIINAENHENQIPAKQKFTLALSRKKSLLSILIE